MSAGYFACGVAAGLGAALASLHTDQPWAMLVMLAVIVAGIIGLIENSAK